jgi:hypothetical protein
MDFRGDKSIESAIHWLCEKGVNNQYRLIQDAYIALEKSQIGEALALEKLVGLRADYNQIILSEITTKYKK